MTNDSSNNTTFRRNISTIDYFMCCPLLFKYINNFIVHEHNPLFSDGHSALELSIKHFLPKWSKMMFYNAYIMPHFDYCVTVWGDCSDLNKLTKLQKQAARIILDCTFKGHVLYIKVAANERLG